MIWKLYHLLKHKINLDWWWRGSEFEISVGALLAPQTRWSNVEKALDNLKKANLLSPEKLSSIDEPTLQALIRPCGFYRQKAKRLQEFSRFYIREWNDLKFADPDTAREKLLQVRGVGKETADSILLYAMEKPKFVVDAYTLKILKCLGIDGNYDTIQALFEKNLPLDVKLFKHYHALIVEFGKRYCNRNRCNECEILTLKN